MTQHFHTIIVYVSGIYYDLFQVSQQTRERETGVFNGIVCRVASKCRPRGVESSRETSFTLAFVASGQTLLGPDLLAVKEDLGEAHVIHHVSMHHL